MVKGRIRNKLNLMHCAQLSCSNRNAVRILLDSIANK